MEHRRCAGGRGGWTGDEKDVAILISRHIVIKKFGTACEESQSLGKRQKNNLCGRHQRYGHRRRTHVVVRVIWATTDQFCNVSVEICRNNEIRVCRIEVKAHVVGCDISQGCCVRASTEYWIGQCRRRTRR